MESENYFLKIGLGFFLFWVGFGLVFFFFFLVVFLKKGAVNTALAFAHVSSEVLVIAVMSDITLHGQSAQVKLFTKVVYSCSELSLPKYMNFHCQQNNCSPVCVLMRPNFRDGKIFGYFW